MRLLLTGAFVCVLTAGGFGVSEARTHVVSAGETVGSIARSQNVDAALLAKLNGLDDARSALRPGRVIALDRAGTEELPVSPDALEAAKSHLKSLDAAVPTEGADLAMWSAESTDASATAAPADPAAEPALEAKLTNHAAHGIVQRFASGIVSRGVSIAANLTRSAMRFIGTPYSFGGTSAGGFDCSGYVQHVFAMLGVHLPRTADAQYVAGHRIAGSMKSGDLVFFQTYERGPSHVGIYLGDGRFIHASSSRGVTVSSLHESYWAARYLGAKRVVD